MNKGFEDRCTVLSMAIAEQATLCSGKVKTEEAVSKTKVVSLALGSNPSISRRGRPRGDARRIPEGRGRRRRDRHLPFEACLLTKGRPTVDRRTKTRSRESSPQRK